MEFNWCFAWQCRFYWLLSSSCWQSCDLCLIWKYAMSVKHLNKTFEASTCSATARPALKADKFLDTRAAMWVKQTTRDLNPTQRADFRWSSARIWLSRLKVCDCRHSLSQQQLLSRRYVLEFTKIFFSELIDVNWQEFMKVQHGDKMWTTGGEASCSFNTSHNITRARM